VLIRLSPQSGQTYRGLVSDPPIDIITPSLQDADAIATVLHKASAAAYTSIVPAGFLWTLQETAASCRRLLSEPAAIVLAAVSGDALARRWLGVSAVLMPGDRPGNAELRRLYVVPEQWGNGIGSHLLAAALERARRAGATTAWLWVLAQNSQARTFTSIVAGACSLARACMIITV
jgi:GNAT superfamily N-acetyltransferase